MKCNLSHYAIESPGVKPPAVAVDATGELIRFDWVITGVGGGWEGAGGGRGRGPGGDRFL